MDPPQRSYTVNEANEMLLTLIEEGRTHNIAIKMVSEETGRLEAAIKKYFQRHGGDETKRHGLCRLTIEQEDIVCSVLIVFSSMHEALTQQQLIKYVKEVFTVHVGPKWVKKFLKRYNNKVTTRQTKLLASKRVNTTILNHVVKFVLQIESLMEH